MPGTIDTSVWIEAWGSFNVTVEVVLSSDSSEGFRSLTLIY